MGGTGYATAGRILIVDCDPATCKSVSDVLAAAGFETACARDDRTAYTIIPTLPTFTALVAEVNLGEGTTSFDVARFARRVIPDLLVIFTAREDAGASVAAFGVPDSQFLLKPFAPADLLRRFAGRGDGRSASANDA